MRLLAASVENAPLAAEVLQSQGICERAFEEFFQIFVGVLSGCMWNMWAFDRLDPMWLPRWRSLFTVLETPRKEILILRDFAPNSPSDGRSVLWSWLALKNVAVSNLF